MLKKCLFGLIIVLIIVIAGCTKNKETAEDSPESSNNGEAKEDVESNEDGAGHIYPFTGMETDEAIDGRMIGVMVNNHPKARPQTGLSKADVVFEILAEGRITRFLALFQSDLPDVIGPIRSAREYYFNLATDYDALYIYHGAANFVNDMISDQGIEHINGSNYDNDGNLFKRESFREAPHNSYLQTDAISGVASEKGYATTFDYKELPFLEEEETIDGDVATNIEIVYSENLNHKVAFDYDADTGRYMRSSDGERTVEQETEEPIGVENVFVVETHHEVIDDDGRRAVDMESGGDAYLFQQGKMLEVEWKNDDGQIIPVKDGEPVGFVPGQTWINVVETDPGLEGSVVISGGSQ